MSTSLSGFLAMMGQYPALILTTILTLAVILVNGWTDAPNAIATCVSTRAMRPRPAIIMAAIFNFLGVLIMTLINKKVAETIYNMVDFGGDAHEALVALCAAMFAIVTWATAAWKFGIPTSESHALIAGLSGAAIALHNGFSGINGAEWLKVIYGLALSTLLGFVLGYVVAKLVALLFGTPIAGGRTSVSATRRSAARPPWLSCTARRTARNSSAFFCWAWRFRAARRKWAWWKFPCG